MMVLVVSADCGFSPASFLPIVKIVVEGHVPYGMLRYCMHASPYTVDEQISQ